MAKPTNVLFVTWDGPDVSYLESLFLPIFSRLADRGFAFHVVQFTWGDAQHRAAMANAAQRHGCSYLAVPILRSPVAVGSLLTSLWGSWHVRRAIGRLHIAVVLPRSTLPALTTRCALRGRSDVAMLFDADGLPHDERVDFGGWSSAGLAYRLLRDLEAMAVRSADVVLTRSKKASEILISRVGPGGVPAKFHVVANGRDEALFKPSPKDERSALRREIGIDDDAPLVAYAGSLGEQYCLAEMLQFFRLVRVQRPDAKLLLLTGSPALADEYLAKHADIRAHCHVMRVPPNEVPRFLAASDLGLALRRPSFSMQAVAPIKLGEYLLCGLAVLTTRAIGDSEELISQEVGRFVDTMALDELELAADWFVHTVLPDAQGFARRSRELGLRRFSLTATVETYAKTLSLAIEGS